MWNICIKYIKITYIHPSLSLFCHLISHSGKLLSPLIIITWEQTTIISCLHYYYSHPFSCIRDCKGKAPFSPAWRHSQPFLCHSSHRKWNCLYSALGVMIRPQAAGLDPCLPQSLGLHCSACLLAPVNLPGLWSGAQAGMAWKPAEGEIPAPPVSSPSQSRPQAQPQMLVLNKTVDFILSETTWTPQLMLGAVE